MVAGASAQEGPGRRLPHGVVGIGQERDRLGFGGPRAQRAQRRRANHGDAVVEQIRRRVVAERLGRQRARIPMLGVRGANQESPVAIAHRALHRLLAKERALSQQHALRIGRKQEEHQRGGGHVDSLERKLKRYQC